MRSSHRTARILGIAGLTLSLLGLVATLWLGADVLFVRPGTDSVFSLRATISLLGLLLAVSALLAAFRFRGSVQARTLPAEAFDTHLLPAVRGFNQAILSNPVLRPDLLSSLMATLLAAGKRVSVLGNSRTTSDVMGALDETGLSPAVNRFLLQGLGERLSIVIFHNGFHSKCALLFLSEPTSVLITVADLDFTRALERLVLRQEDISRPLEPDDLGDFAQYLSFIEDHRQKYLANFRDITDGYVSFYGTEVLELQSGWLESGKINRLRATDILTDPALRLSRKRYHEANRYVIQELGGTVSRCFMFERSRLNSARFKRDLLQLLQTQQRIGVSLGIQFLDDLPAAKKQDIAIFDDFAVLVEERQANYDYTFAKSTAYFSKQRIGEYRVLFDEVWSGKGTGKSATEVLEGLLGETLDT